LAWRFRDRGLAVVTLDFDDVDDARRVEKVLDLDGASLATNLICNAGDSPRAAEAFEIPGGALPHYKLYDRKGILRHAIGVDPAASQQFTTADVDAAVEELLVE
jgi:hypothetical protein